MLQVNGSANSPTFLRKFLVQVMGYSDLEPVGGGRISNQVLVQVMTENTNLLQDWRLPWEGCHGHRLGGRRRKATMVSAPSVIFPVRDRVRNKDVSRVGASRMTANMSDPPTVRGSRIRDRCCPPVGVKTW
uniref:Uncharacterized protein n=1 Tax=Branchiostoma floridae TaxID=7739 RepID=C3ZP13_BRAFL|eukprot:XP_002589737.1 hypothetical protein BRAFLDRAFT_97788 [Branchiostoma floridae]